MTVCTATGQSQASLEVGWEGVSGEDTGAGSAESLAQGSPTPARSYPPHTPPHMTSPGHIGAADLNPVVSLAPSTLSVVLLTG